MQPAPSSSTWQAMDQKGSKTAEPEVRAGIGATNDEAASNEGGHQSHSAGTQNQGEAASGNLGLPPHVEGEPVPPKLDKRVDSKIRQSQEVVNRLNQLGSVKLTQLYSSLCRISLIEHPALAQIGAWAFFETLSRLIFANAQASFVANFRSEMNQVWYKEDPKKKKQSIAHALEHISNEGNCDKHCATYVTVDARQLAVRFDLLEDLLIFALDRAIQMK
ncbi:MAG: hypothetical protein NVV73_07520 [Cellvibrionaceae bacterium]|nr:hypothetical protein [Cellvibrionaceae bacterium]